MGRRLLVPVVEEISGVEMAEQRELKQALIYETIIEIRWLRYTRDQIQSRENTLKRRLESFGMSEEEMLDYTNEELVEAIRGATVSEISHRNAAAG